MYGRKSPDGPLSSPFGRPWRKLPFRPSSRVTQSPGSAALLLRAAASCRLDLRHFVAVARASHGTFTHYLAGVVDRITFESPERCALSVLPYEVMQGTGPRSARYENLALVVDGKSLTRRVAREGEVDELPALTETPASGRPGA
jgi:hypothetical protein